MFTWSLNQVNLITFVMVDANGNEVPGLGAGLTVNLSKSGAGFALGTGTVAEMGSGWYSYEATAAEADTVGPVSIAVTGAGCVQQNLEYMVLQRTPNAVPFTYTVTNSLTLAPVSGAEVWITSDLAGDDTIWHGTTDTFGVARDTDGTLPWLDPGVVYVWVQVAGYETDAWPDTEVVT